MLTFHFQHFHHFYNDITVLLILLIIISKTKRRQTPGACKYILLVCLPLLVPKILYGNIYFVVTEFYFQQHPVYRL